MNSGKLTRTDQYRETRGESPAGTVMELAAQTVERGHIRAVIDQFRETISGSIDQDLVIGNISIVYLSHPRL